MHKTAVPPIPVPVYPKKEQDSIAVGFKKFIKRCFRIIRSTVGLMLILVAYSFAGAALFRWLEGKHEAQEKAEIQQLRESIIDRVFYTSRFVYSIILFERFWRTSFLFCGSTDTPCFGLLVMSALGFKVRMNNPSLAGFVACMQLIPQFHLCCDLFAATPDLFSSIIDRVFYTNRFVFQYYRQGVLHQQVCSLVL